MGNFRRIRVLLERDMILRPLEEHVRPLVAAILSILFAAIVPGCTSTAVNHQLLQVAADSQGVRAVPVGPPENAAPLDWHAYDSYVNGTLFELSGNYMMAAESYKQSLNYVPESYQIRMSYARMLFRLQRFQDVLATLGIIDPQDAEVWFLRAAGYRALSMLDAARDAYLHTVEEDSSHTGAFSNLAGLYSRMGNLDSTAWAYENLLRIDPLRHRLWLDLGKLQVQLRQFDRAKESFRRSFEARGDVTNIMAIIGLAEVHRHLEQADSAVGAYRLGLEVDSSNVLIHRELIGLLVEQDSLLSAVGHARKVVELNPLNRADVRRLAMLYFGVDSLAAADSLFTYLVRSGERHVLNHHYLGRIAALSEDYQRARDEFSLVIQMADTVAQGWLDLGWAYRRLGNADKEIETYESGLNHMKDEPSAIRLLFALGAAFEQSGRIDEAVDTFEEIIAHDTTYTQALNYLGYMLADRGERLEYAYELIERAVRLVPDNAAYLDSYGWVYYRLGQFEEAVVHLQSAVKLDTDPIIFDHLGDAYNALGKIEEARQWWQKALQLDPDNQAIIDKLAL